LSAALPPNGPPATGAPANGAPASGPPASSAPVAAPAEPSPPPPGAEDDHAFKKKFARGSAWAIVNYVVGYSIRLGSNLILWRLLYPDAFGLMAIVNVFIQGLSMFSDIGIGQSVVQHARGEDPTFLNTVWTLQVVRGLFICFLACLAAIPVARFYHQPLLAHLVPVVAIGCGLSAFNSTNLFTASRRLTIGRLTLVDIASQGGSLVVMVIWSYLTHSVWGLAVGSVVSPAIRLYLSFTVLPGVKNRFCWDRTTVVAVSHFGRWIFFSTMLAFLASYSDRLIFGKLVSIERLGVYSIALVWATFPAYIISHLVNTVLFPLFSRVNEQGGSMPDMFRKFRGPLLFAAGWLFACLLAGGSTLVRFLYDQRAAEAGMIVQILAVGCWFSTLDSMNGSVLLALGKPQPMLFSQIGKLLGMVILLPIGAHFFGFYVTVSCLSLSEVLRYAVSARACFRSHLRSLRQDFGFSLAVGLTGFLGLLVRAGYRQLHLRFHNGHLDAFVEGSAIFLVLTAIWLGSFVLSRRRAGRVLPLAVG
jgi:O-antigen/teichoic acid export membrane protein